jgi:hypothetical protein
VFIVTSPRSSRPFTLSKRIAAQFKRKSVPLFSTAYNIPFQQLFSFDIDTILPRVGVDRFDPPPLRSVSLRTICANRPFIFNSLQTAFLLSPFL